MSTAVHHLNCAPMSPRLHAGGRLTPRRMVAHCLLIEGAEGLTLVDSGFGNEDLATKRMGRGFITMMRPSLDPADTALAQVVERGFDPSDVRDIVVTHLDLDHAGGIGDFPQARVHVFADEHSAAMAPRGPIEKSRYIAGQWSHGPLWEVHAVQGDQWLGFESVRAVGDDVLLVPLRGHTRGHCAVAVKRPSGGWLLHAGDAYFNEGEKQTPPTCPSGLATFQSVIQMDKAARHANQERLRSLHATHGPGSGAAPEDTVTIFSAHDPAEYDALAGLTD